jgi:hypothetical protein
MRAFAREGTAMRYANLVLMLALTAPLVAQVQVIKGSSRPEPPPAAAPAGETAPAAEEAKPPADPRERRQQERVVYQSGGQSRPDSVSVQRSVNAGTKSLAQRVKSINGREVPYLTENERVVSESAGLKVTERTRQRYDATGSPASQDSERVEERKLPDGTVETTTTVYTADINGRMNPAERRIVRMKKTGNQTRTVTTTQTTGSSGGFQTIVEEESVEQREGEHAGTVETTKKTLQAGSGLQVTSREQTVMRVDKGVAITETQTFERSPATAELELSKRTVGKLTERPDGSSSETVETYGFNAGSGVNLNATQMELQSVQTSQTSVSRDGTVNEKISYKERSAANPREFTAETLTQKVSKPTADGESVRTDVYEKGVNGRMTATESLIEKVEK